MRTRPLSRPRTTLSACRRSRVLIGVCLFMACTHRSAGDVEPVSHACVMRGMQLIPITDTAGLAEQDTAITIAASNSGDYADQAWVTATDDFEFRGERYFRGPAGVMAGQMIPTGTARATLRAVGEHHGVTLYTWDDYQGLDPIPVLFVIRANGPCNILQYWHVLQLR